MYEDDILAVMRRYDQDSDARLSFKEFSEAILPSKTKLRKSIIRESQAIHLSGKKAES